MKRKTTKDILVESFREVAEKQAIDKITIKDIVDNCEYSSATFYRHFRDKYDLIAWAYRQDMERIVERFEFDETSWKQCLIDCAQYYYEHKEYLANLLLNTSGYESFVLNMTEINYTSLMNKVQKSVPSLDEKTKMMIRIYVNGTVYFTCEWILGKYKTTPEQLSEAYMISIPEPLKQYLY
ncbi:MAG: TetR/AcrR family transcriptional regulator [Sphaerochaetaceae bacterium]|nr:TetR/AcrR family transcriptional regulator [Sphaerochaetaceae bacterium]